MNLVSNSALFALRYIYIYISTYKFKRAFFRHDRRTAPKFGTHVRIETRLALTKNKLTNPTPEGFRGLFIACRAVRSSVVRSFAPVVCVR